MYRFRTLANAIYQGAVAVVNTPIREIIEIGRRMSDRWMTNSAGGNISVRAGDQIYISPRYADYFWNWKLSPDDIVVGPINSDELTNNPSFPRAAFLRGPKGN